MRVGERATTDLRFDFGIRDLIPLSSPHEAVYLVQFVCGCLVVVKDGRPLWRTRGFTLVCEHVATT